MSFYLDPEIAAYDLNLASLIRDCEVAGSVTFGDKLKVKENALWRGSYFEISPCHHPLGWIHQSVLRTFDNWTGHAEANNVSVRLHFQELSRGLNKRVIDLKSYLEGANREVILNKIKFAIQRVLTNRTNLLSMYANSKDKESISTQETIKFFMSNLHEIDKGLHFQGPPSYCDPLEDSCEILLIEEETV